MIFVNVVNFPPGLSETPDKRALGPKSFAFNEFSERTE
jgi:hypothetical protein